MDPYKESEGKNESVNTWQRFLPKRCEKVFQHLNILWYHSLNKSFPFGCFMSNALMLNDLYFNTLPASLIQRQRLLFMESCWNYVNYACHSRVKTLRPCCEKLLKISRRFSIVFWEKFSISRCRKTLLVVWLVLPLKYLPPFSISWWKSKADCSNNSTLINSLKSQTIFYLVATASESQFQFNFGRTCFQLEI